MWCAVRESRDCIFLMAPDALLTPMSSKAVEAERDVLQEASSYLEGVGRFRCRCPGACPCWDGWGALGHSCTQVPGWGRRGRLWPQTPPRTMWALPLQPFPKGAPLSHGSGSPPEEPLCLLSGKLQPACLAFESLPRLCLFSLLFQTSFVPFWLS